MKHFRLIIIVICYLLSVNCSIAQNLVEDSATISVDTLVGGKPHKVYRNYANWRPETKRALWLAIVFPGAGQIYNRKFWKLPIIYGGIVGCAYAWSWNNQMYKDYKQAYLDIMDSDPNTKSYEDFMHHITIDSSNLSHYQDVFSKRKDKFRRWRDLSIFCLIGVYAISIIDAYIDASLSEFDISDDLSLHIQPTYINTNPNANLNANPNANLNANPNANVNPNANLNQGAWGLQCSLSF